MIILQRFFNFRMIFTDFGILDTQISWFFNENLCFQAFFFWALLKALRDLDDHFATIFQFSNDFYGFWWTWFNFAHVFEPLLTVLLHFRHANFVIFRWKLTISSIFLDSGTGFFKNHHVFGGLPTALCNFFMFFTFWSRCGALLKALRNLGDHLAIIVQLLDDLL